MLRINKQLGRSLRTINIILFVRLQKRDGMTWISIFKPVPPVCVTKGFDPIWECKWRLRSSRLASSGGKQKSRRSLTGTSADWTRRVHVCGVGGRERDNQFQQRCRCPGCVRGVARGCEQPRCPSLCSTRLPWNRAFTCVSPSCGAPATSARTATDLLKRNAFSGSVSSLVTGPASGATLIVWPSAVTRCYAEPTGQARVLAGDRPENQINGVTQQKCTRSFRTKLNINFFKMVFWNIPPNQMTVLLPYLHGLVCV